MADTVDVVAAHRPYGLDCKCGRPINSDADWARHLIDALGLTEEWRCIGWVSTSTEKTAWLQHQSNGGEVQSRLLSPWVRKDNTNE